MKEDSIAFDTLLDLCQNQHRRIVLGELAKDQRSRTLDELMKAILKYNHSTTPAEASETVQSEIRLSLHHSHIPKLAEHSLIEYDPARQRVERTPRFDHLVTHLSSIIDADPDLEARATP